MRPAVCLAILALATLAGLREAVAAEQFRAPYLIFPVGTMPPITNDQFGPIDVAAGDMNGDRKDDLALVCREVSGPSAGNQLSILISQGNPNVPDFAPAINYVTGRTPHRVALGDLDNDGALDVVTTDPGANAVSVFRNLGGGLLGPRTSYPLLAFGNGITLEDVNQDGRRDIELSSSSGLRVLLASGAPGSFGAAIATSTPGTPIAIAAGLVDGDAIPDLVLATTLPDALVILHGVGDGTFTLAGTPALLHPATALELADVTGDGKLDAVVSSAASWLTVYAGGATPFTSAAVDQPLPHPAYDLVARDLNQDGHVDVAAAMKAGNGSAQETCAILMGNGIGGFSSMTLADLGPYLEGIAAGDFNADGRMDLVGCGRGDASVTIYQHSANVLLQNPDGTFGFSYKTPAYDVTTCHVIRADMDRDGKDDLVLAGLNENIAQALVTIRPGMGDGTWAPGFEFVMPGNRLPVVVPGDFNRDGKTDLAVTQNYSYASSVTTTYLGNGDGTIAPLGASTLNSKAVLAAADFNRDGKLDLLVADSTAFHWTWVIMNGNGDGTFSTGWQYAAVGTDRPMSGAVGDVNRDGIPDFVTMIQYPSNSTVLLFLGNGDGTMAAPTSLSTLQSYFSSLEDITNDGILDLLVPTYPLIYAGAWLNAGNGDGTFAQPVQEIVDHANATSVLAADTNRDGWSDLIADAGNTIGGETNASRVDVWLGNGQPMVFGALNSYGVGRGSLGLTLVDANRDGRDDLVAADLDPGNAGGTPWLRTLLGNGPPTFDFPGYYTPSTTPAPPLTVALKDFTRDGKLDAIVTRNDPSGSFYSTLMVGDGEGNFTSAVSSVVPDEPVATASGDLNRDGILDVAIACGAGDAVVVQLGTAGGSLTPPITVAMGLGYEFSDIAIGDFDRDGKPDLAAASAAASAILIFAGNGDGTFASPVSFSTGRSGPTSIGTGDVDRNGCPDLVAALGSGITPSEVGVLLGNGDGTFQAMHFYPCGPSPYALTLADLNRDGILDAAVSRTGVPGSQFLSVLLGTSAGGFAGAAAYAISGTAFDVVAADVDGDGIPDLLAPNGFGISTFSYLHGRGDGTFAANENHAIGASPVALAVADLNKDGRPDVAAAVNGTSNLGVLLSGHSAISAVSPETTASPRAPRMTIRPNPAQGEATLTFQLPSPGSGSVTLFDVRGRRVVRLFEGPMRDVVALKWDGRLEGGARAAAGIYFARLSAAGYPEVTRRLAWLR